MNPASKLRYGLTITFSLAIAAWWFYSQILLPQPVHVGADPQIAYMLSSLSPFKGEAYTFIDHPGTPVEIIGTVILALTYPFMRVGDRSFVMAHLQNPLLFLTVVRSLLVLMSIFTLFLITTYVLRKRHWTDELGALAVAVLFFAVYPRAFDEITTWSHNSFSYPFGALLGLGVILIFRDHAGGTWQQRAALGFLLGILAAIQIYFLTCVLGAVVVAVFYALLKRERKLAFTLSAQIGLAAVFGFVLTTLPIMPKYGEFIRWIVTVTSHQGRHGSGPPGFISLSSAVTNLNTLIGQAPLVFYSVAITLILLGVAASRGSENWRSKPGLWACALGFSTQLVVMMLLILKHPGILYLQTVVVSLTMLLAVTIELVRPQKAQAIKIQRLGLFGLSLVIFTLFGFNLVRAVMFHNAESKHVDAAEEEIMSFLEEYQSQEGLGSTGVTTLWVYGMPSTCNALWYGNRYAHNSFSNEIGEFCPRDFNYDLWEGLVTIRDGTHIPLREITWDVLIANEAALLDFPDLNKLGETIYSEVRLGTFGRIIYILNL
jgi:hypothetical protein